jgi:hypothetical protein
MFSSTEEALGGRFSSDEEVISAAQNWLKMPPKNFFVRELKNCETLEPVS